LRTALRHGRVDGTLLLEPRQLPEAESDADSRDDEDEHGADDAGACGHRAGGAGVLFSGHADAPLPCEPFCECCSGSRTPAAGSETLRVIASICILAAAPPRPYPVSNDPEN